MDESELLESITELTDYISLGPKINCLISKNVYPLLSQETYHKLKEKYGSIENLKIEDALQNLSLAVKYMCYDNEILSRQKRWIFGRGLCLQKENERLSMCLLNQENEIKQLKQKYDRR